MTRLDLPGRQVSEIFAPRRLEVPGADPGVWTGGDRTVATSTNPNTNTKGAWVEHTAGLTYDCYGILYMQGTVATVNRPFFVDIGTGAAGSETVLVADLFFTTGGSNPYSWDTFHIPIFIPRNTRIAIRSQDTQNASDAQTANLYYLNYPVFRPPLCRTCETYGNTAATTRGVQIDPGGTADTKSAYSTLVASTAKRVRWLTLHVGGGNSTRSDYSWQMDVATGGAGSEQILIADLNFRSSSLFTVPAPGVFGPFPVDIPAGTRIAIRGSCSGTDATDRLWDTVGYGFSA